MSQPQTAAAQALRSLGARRSLAVLVGVAGLVAALVFLPGRFRHINQQVSALAAMAPQERQLRAARGVDVDTGVYLLARRVIPPTATYIVTTGPGVRVSTPVTYPGVGAFAVLFLLPRISVQNPREAQYVISYGGDLHKSGVPIGRIWTYKPGIEIAEAAR